MAVISTILSGHLSVLLPQLFCYCFLVVYCSSLFVCSLGLLGLWVTFPNIFSILFLRSWINFTSIVLNSFSGRLPICTSFSCFGGFYLVPSSGTQHSAFSSWLTSYDVVFVLATVRLWFFLLLLFALCWKRLTGLCKLPDGRDWW